MSEFGLAAVSNPSEIFLSDNFPDSDILAGLAIAVVVDGSRTFLIEIQVCLIIRTINGEELYWNLAIVVVTFVVVILDNAKTLLFF